MAENLSIESSSISIDKKQKISIFKGDVSVIDEKKNKLNTQYAEYNKDLKLLESKGDTTIKTSEGFYLTGIHADKDKEILSVCPKARDRSLK